MLDTIAAIIAIIGLVFGSIQLEKYYKKQRKLYEEEQQKKHKEVVQLLRSISEEISMLSCEVHLLHEKK